MQQQSVEAYPLAWPPGFARSRHREKGRFATSLPGALKNVRNSLALFARDSGKALSSLVISSNVSLGNERPDDPGVSVWFTWDGLQVCIPVDRYATVEANLQAIHLIVEARRTELRHGTLALVRASFTGFAALPPPAGSRPWRASLEYSADARPSRAEAEARYKAMAMKAHPDAGGSADRMAELNRAIEEARRELS
jgi:hypothetical protein